MTCINKIEISHEANQLAMYCREHQWYVKVPNHTTLGKLCEQAIAHTATRSAEAGKGGHADRPDSVRPGDQVRHR